MKCHGETIHITKKTWNPSGLSAAIGITNDSSRTDGLKKWISLSGRLTRGADETPHVVWLVWLLDFECFWCRWSYRCNLAMVTRIISVNFLIRQYMSVAVKSLNARAMTTKISINIEEWESVSLSLSVTVSWSLSVTHWQQQWHKFVSYVVISKRFCGAERWKRSLKRTLPIACDSTLVRSWNH